MTGVPKPEDQGTKNAQQSLSLLGDHKELLRLRLLPSELARLLGVSKQTVSMWVKHGSITPPSPIDGRLDVQRAVRDVLRNTDPGKMRARVLRQAASDALELRENLARAEERAEIAEAALQQALSRIEFLERWAAYGDRSLEIFRGLIVEQADLMRAAPTEEWPTILEELLDAAVLEADPVDDDDLADFLSASDTPRVIPENEGSGADAAATQIAAPQPQPKGDPND